MKYKPDLTNLRGLADKALEMRRKFITKHGQAQYNHIARKGFGIGGWGGDHIRVPLDDFIGMLDDLEVSYAGK